MGLFRQALFHPADVPGGVPEGIILRADQQKLALDALHGDHLLLLEGMGSLGVVKDLAGVHPVPGALALGHEDLPVLGMLVAEGHVGQGLAPVAEEGFSGNGPLLAAVPVPLREALPDEVAGGHGDGQRQRREVRRRRQGQGTGGGCPIDAHLPVSVGGEPGDGGLDALQGVVVVAVVLFRRGHGEDADSLPQQPLHGGAGHVVLRVVPQHGDDGAVRALAGPVGAVEAVGLRIKMDVFHALPPLSCRTGGRKRLFAFSSVSSDSS